MKDDDKKRGKGTPFPLGFQGGGYLRFHGRDAGGELAAQEHGIELFHAGLDIIRNLVLEVMEGCVGCITQVVPSREGRAASLGILRQGKQFRNAWGDEFHRAGKHARGSLGQGEVLVGVHANSIDAAGSRLDRKSVV